MTVRAKAITREFYGRLPRYSYWIGCSTGGKEGLMEAQRFPADYDGIVAVAPANNWTKLVDPGIFDAVLPVYVTADDPERLQFNLVADQVGALAATTGDLMTAARRDYATRAVMQRLHQQYFRRIVLKAYRNQCSICRLRHVDLLDAAHILADRHPLGEPIVTNGLGLCKIHHSAFDANILGIDPDAFVHVREDVLNEKDGPMLLHGLQEVHESRLILPRTANLRPNREFLAERFDAFRAA
jgi:putative restriction endonuclease